MKSMFSKLAMAGLLMISAVVGTAPTASAEGASASLRTLANVVQPADGVKAEQVQYRHHRDRRWHRHHGRHHYRDHRRHRGYYRHRGPSVYFGVAPTYRYARPRYVAPRARAYRSSHVNWCYNRYRSYRASDNTYQPYHGPRRQCYSPFR
ncbi:BA14K family protein [Tianweitania sp. BSSL-BM11]|uniref:Lectin-like protein BA14k n=1 Tax=Tianweitania aestuarii TaxID=2814886 RepID=A0ABS5RUX0_9HYPH|nr:BA14K family protein [Tianweitania aestuarii]MBS9720858.1 BA14K family protein [Tianweitania aestuarii]